MGSRWTVGIRVGHRESLYRTRKELTIRGGVSIPGYTQAVRSKSTTIFEVAGSLVRSHGREAGIDLGRALNASSEV